jgi:hypothetical protein
MATKNKEIATTQESTLSPETVAELALAQAEIRRLELELANQEITISLHRREIDVTKLAKMANDARSTIGRMRTGETSALKVGGNAAKGTLTDWEGHTLRAPETDTERRAIRLDKAISALVREYHA